MIVLICEKNSLAIIREMSLHTLDMLHYGFLVCSRQVNALSRPPILCALRSRSISKKYSSSSKYEYTTLFDVLFKHRIVAECRTNLTDGPFPS